MTDIERPPPERIWTTGGPYSGSWNSNKASYKNPPKETEYVSLKRVQEMEDAWESSVSDLLKTMRELERELLELRHDTSS